MSMIAGTSQEITPCINENAAITVHASFTPIENARTRIHTRKHVHTPACRNASTYARTHQDTHVDMHNRGHMRALRLPCTHAHRRTHTFARAYAHVHTHTWAHAWLPPRTSWAWARRVTWRQRAPDGCGIICSQKGRLSMQLQTISSNLPW